jgi:hypothetical protein
MQCEDGFFPITSVHRMDIKEALHLTDEQVARFTDDMIRQIARKMASDYCEQLFWDHLVDETITHLEIDGEIVKELGTGDLHNRNCPRCTEPHIYEDYKHLDEEPEMLMDRRCCLNCIHFNDQDSTCPEGGFSEIGNPYKTLSQEDCNGFRAKSIEGQC